MHPKPRTSISPHAKCIPRRTDYDAALKTAVRAIPIEKLTKIGRKSRLLQKIINYDEKKSAGGNLSSPKPPGGVHASWTVDEYRSFCYFKLYFSCLLQGSGIKFAANIRKAVDSSSQCELIRRWVVHGHSEKTANGLTIVLTWVNFLFLRGRSRDGEVWADPGRVGLTRGPLPSTLVASRYSELKTSQHTHIASIRSEHK